MPSDIELLMSSLTVNPTETQMALINGYPDKMITLAITNSDGSQTLNCYIQRGTKAGSPWAQSNIDAFTSIAPGETRIETFDIDGVPAIRVYGTASGAGLQAAIGYRKHI